MQSSGLTNGPVPERKMLLNVSDFICMTATAHTAKAPQEWCSTRSPRFWMKGEWPANSHDLNPIENNWGILSERLEEMGQVLRFDDLISNLKKAWREIQPSLLEKPVNSMSSRIKLVIHNTVHPR